ncbi:DUF5368 domain-containing protein [Aquabacter spiritensis]|uniref:Uncharacterized protein n=1 Tax=Aquabacter spiritensis TaxID=933073 RepID=A0A4R3M0K3_9HYPH|nr:DUF5368 domain-containing protein [Aquabacter spiritensis]TCT04617.1 hypothetical protein EDC64_10648 [Aquabacter spiritensis]
MKDLDPAILFSVLQEILGGLFWPLVAGALLAGLAFLVVLVRDRRLVSDRFLMSELIGLAGGVFAIWLAFVVTDSNFADIGGPIDWVLLIVLFALGGVGGTLCAYLLLALVRPQRVGGA